MKPKFEFPELFDVSDWKLTGKMRFVPVTLYLKELDLAYTNQPRPEGKRIRINNSGVELSFGEDGRLLSVGTRKS
jgi:hypothetical protein